MINMIKKLLIFKFFLIFSTPSMAYSSSQFLISQSAFKNHDYTEVLSNFSINKIKSFNSNLMDKAISAVISEDIDLANKIASEILSKDDQNQEAIIIKIVYFYYNKNFNKISEVQKNLNNQNELIDFIFFNNNNLKDNITISKSLVDIVLSSYSNADIRSLNYNFLFFYLSLSKIIDPNNDRATLIKGELFQNLKKERTARKLFENIKENSPYYIEAQKSLAYNFSTFLPFKEAEKNIKQLLQNTNNNYFIKKVLADFYRYEKKYEFAISIYDELIEKKNDDLWNIYYKRGVCYERLGNWDKAENNFLKSLEIKPDAANVLNYLAYGWVERGEKLDRSLKMLNEALAENPDSFYIIDSLAWAYFKKNNLDEASRLMEKVIDMAPGEAISLDHLGDIYYAMDRKREAIHFWQQALELAEPEDDIKEDIKLKLEKFNAG